MKNQAVAKLLNLTWSHCRPVWHIVMRLFDRPMTAKIRVVSSMYDISVCEVNGHRIEFGGQGDGYCYAHQSFDCLDNLSDQEKAAIDDAEFINTIQGEY